MKKSLTTLVIVAATLCANTAFSTEFVHKILSYKAQADVKHVVSRLDHFGAEGWELVAVTHLPVRGNSNGYTQYTLRKEVKK